MVCHPVHLSRVMNVQPAGNSLTLPTAVRLPMYLSIVAALYRKDVADSNGDEKRQHRLCIYVYGCRSCGEQYVGGLAWSTSVLRASGGRELRGSTARDGRCMGQPVE